MALPFLLLGLLALWAGTEILLKGVMRLADHYGLSHVFTGLVILSIITDLPETAIAIASSIKQLKGIEASGIIIGNSIGSSISQITAVLGISGLYGYFTLTKEQMFEDGAFLLGSVALLFFLGLDGNITMAEGAAMLLIYMLYYWLMLRREKVALKLKRKRIKKLYQVILYIVAGTLILITGSELAVRNALVLADRWHVSQSFVGIIIIGLSTSLPELAVSISSALKKAPGLSVGNIIGSNIYDILMPVGLSAVISPLSFEKKIIQVDVPFLLVATTLVLVFFWKKKGLQKKEATGLIVLFVLFYFYKIINP
ncbi:MAG: sodium:calcium antiporter [Roseivirga sp.]|nr:sodium:calcium antiporter [Roseivirga sp.]